MPELFKRGHALLIGAGGDLLFTMDDARGLANTIADPEHCAYPPDQVELLIGDAADRSGVLVGLDKLAERADENSIVVIYFSGHCYHVRSNIVDAFYLMPFSYNFEQLKETAISGLEFAAKLKAIQSRHLLLFLDCCHAGNNGSTKGVDLISAPFPYEVLEIISPENGRVMIASSNDDELSYGGRVYSAFALSLIEAFCGKGISKPDGYVRAADLAKYVSKMVPIRTKRKQHPILYFESNNFEIAYYAGGDTKQNDPIFDERASQIILSDKPTSIDLLGYKNFTDPIAKRINQLDSSDTPLAIGIFGEWGCGKTSFLEMIRESLSNNYNINTLVFNAWKYENEENLWSALVQCILNHAELNCAGAWFDRLKIRLKLWRMSLNLSTGLSEIIKSIMSLVFKAVILISLIYLIFIILFQPHISAYATELNLTESQVALVKDSGISVFLLGLIIVFLAPKIEPLLNLFNSNLNFDFSKFSNDMSYQERISFFDKLSEEFREIVELVTDKKPIVIIIDDLDRCLPRKALQVIEGIKLFLDMEYCVYLFALDRDIIERIVHVKYKDLNLSDEELKRLRENYIEKLIQVPIPIPPIDDDRFNEFIKTLYSKYDNIYGEYISNIFSHALPHNPRKTKHMIQYYLLLGTI